MLQKKCVLSTLFKIICFFATSKNVRIGSSSHLISNSIRRMETPFLDQNVPISTKDIKEIDKIIEA